VDGEESLRTEVCAGRAGRRQYVREQLGRRSARLSDRHHAAQPEWYRAVERRAARHVSAEFALSLTINPPVFVASMPPAPNGMVAVWYQLAGSTSGQVVGGALPAGLSLAADGTISGTPTTVGTFTFTVRAADSGWSSNVATASLSIVVASGEVVLYTADASRVSGAWSLVAGATAAGGKTHVEPRCRCREVDHAAGIAFQLLRADVPGRRRRCVSPVDARQGSQQLLG
jgi:hypothetical protein